MAASCPGPAVPARGGYFDLEQVGNPQIAPDGKTIVYTRGWVDRVNDHWDNAIWVMSADGTKNRFLTKGSSPVWSPDGTRIAYLAAADEPKGTQIFVRWMDAEGATTQVTRVTESPGTIKWTPDGKTLYFDGNDDTAGADHAAAVPGGVSRNPVDSVELDPDPALHDELVPEVRWEADVMTA